MKCIEHGQNIESVFTLNPATRNISFHRLHYNIYGLLNNLFFQRKFICKCSAGKKCQDYPWKPGEKEEWIAEKHQKRLEMRRRREQNKEKKKNVDKRKKSVGQSNKRKSDTLSRSDIKKSKL